MATTTTKLSLIKPALTDIVDVSNLNDNADSIDAAVGFTLCTNATRPASPWAGQVIFETDTGSSFVWDGDSWEAAGGGGGSITVAATAPSPASDGDLWWDSTNGELYLYYNDGTSSQWVAAAGPSVTVQSTAPTGYEGQLWLDDTDGSMYVYYTDPGGGSSSWIGAVSRSGGILQVVSTTKTDTFSASVATGAFTSNITGLEATITPRSTSSKILVQISVDGASSQAYGHLGYQLLRDGSPVGVGDAAGSREPLTAQNLNFGSDNSDMSSASKIFLDSPNTTSSVTYGIKIHNQYGATATLYVNRSSSDLDLVRRGRSISTITLMEVAG